MLHYRAYKLHGSLDGVTTELPERLTLTFQGFALVASQTLSVRPPSDYLVFRHVPSLRDTVTRISRVVMKVLTRLP